MKMTVSRLKGVVLFNGTIFILFGLGQAITAFLASHPNPQEVRNYNWKDQTFIYRDMYIEESWMYDSVKGEKYNIELCAKNQGYDHRTNSTERRFDLQNPKYQHISMIFVIYYLFTTCLWGIVFYYLYRLVLMFYKNNVFSIKNPEFLRKLGKMIIAIGTANFFANMIIPLFIMLIAEGHIRTTYNYDILTEWLFLVMIGNILLMLCNAFNKGITLEKEQELVI